MEEELIKCIICNKDVFSWKTEDMLGIDTIFIGHKLSLNSNPKPVAQKRRKFRDDKRKAIKEEVEKLLAANFIKKVKYLAWLANIVMVKNSNGK